MKTLNNQQTLQTTASNTDLLKRLVKSRWGTSTTIGKADVNRQETRKRLASNRRAILPCMLGQVLTPTPRLNAKDDEPLKH
jgi:hypothetical protein